MTVRETPVQVAKVAVDCDGCSRDIGAGDDVFCAHCRTLPDRHVEPSEVAAGMRDWFDRNRRALTDVELELLERVADHIEQGRRL